jgi:hypothetical protein
MLMRLTKGKRPWTFCFNPQCPTNKAWIEKRDAYNREKLNLDAKENLEKEEEKE